MLGCTCPHEKTTISPMEEIQPTGTSTLEDILKKRRSVREFTGEPLTDDEILKLLFAMQGITDVSGKRTAPSAGALYPLEVYVATENGFSHYNPNEDAVETINEKDMRPIIHKAGLRQESILSAPAVFLITAIPERTSVKYGDRAERYVWIEAGHAAQNLLLQATKMGFGGVPIGAFDDNALHRNLSLPENQTTLYILPVGHPDRS